MLDGRGDRVVSGMCGLVCHARRLGRHAVGVLQVVRWRDVLVLATAEQRGERGQESGRIAERPVRVELELEEVLAHEDDHLGSRQYAEVGRQPELESVFPDQAVTERVKGGDGRVRVPIRDQLVDTHGHLLGRLVREGQGQDLRWPGSPACDQPGDPARDDLCLAGAGAGDDEQRPVAVSNGPKLVRIQATQQRIESMRRVHALARVHDGHEVRPGGQLVERRRFTAAADARCAHRRIRIDRRVSRGHAGSIARGRVT